MIVAVNDEWLAEYVILTGDRGRSGEYGAVLEIEGLDRAVQQRYFHENELVHTMDEWTQVMRKGLGK